MSRDDVARLRSIVGRLDDEDVARVDPPVELWGRIAAAVAESDPAGPAGAVTVVDADLDRLRAIAARVDDVDVARVDPPVELWGRIAAAVAEPDAVPSGAPPEVAPVVSL
ncbi:MAG TPA: hypothetical protein PKA98_16690, partial [Acidimicrobiales bacterium]|nr:hypothetical protein [Acidimicrobiales bacterium]